MDRILRPSEFDADPSSPNASKLWAHWLRRFNNFLGTLGDQNADKLSILTNFVSPTVYELIADENNYDRAMPI